MTLTTKIRVSCVSYLNSKPFLFGLEHHPVSELLEISLDHPRDCAEKLIDGRADIGLVPVASLLKIPDYRIITNKCIGADGPVASVMLFSNVPLEEISEIRQDYQSMTSVNLCRLLCNDFWKIHPEFKDAKPGYENEIGGTIAGVIIGDRALEMRNRFQYQYDLAEEWKKWTGLPFVFACWVSNREIPEAIIYGMNEALENGLKSLEQIAMNESKKSPLNQEAIIDYFTNKLRYTLNEKFQTAMELFLMKMKSLKSENFTKN